MVVPRSVADALPTLLATIGDVAIKEDVGGDADDDGEVVTPRYARKSKRKLHKAVETTLVALAASDACANDREQVASAASVLLDALGLPHSAWISAVEKARRSTVH